MSMSDDDDRSWSGKVIDADFGLSCEEQYSCLIFKSRRL